MSSSIVRLLLLAIALLATSSGNAAAQTTGAATTAQQTFAFGGLDRTYRLYRPASLTSTMPVPLVVMLHGGFGNGAQAERAYGWDDAADAGRFIVLYPDGVRRSWNAGTCCGRASADNVDDVGFLTALITKIMQQEHVDTRRVYVTGMSNGALMTYRLACESALAIAAIGPVAGTFSPSCRGVRPTSVLAIHGLDDTSIPYNGGLGLQTHDVRFPSVPSTLAWWRTFDHCDAPAQSTAGSVTTSSAHCTNGRDVELVTIAGTGHQWPGSKRPPARQQAVIKRLTGRELATPSTAIDATARLWQFFSAHAAFE